MIFRSVVGFAAVIAAFRAPQRWQPAIALVCCAALVVARFIHFLSMEEGNGTYRSGSQISNFDRIGRSRYDRFGNYQGDVEE